MCGHPWFTFVEVPVMDRKPRVGFRVKHRSDLHYEIYDTIGNLYLIPNNHFGEKVIGYAVDKLTHKGTFVMADSPESKLCLEAIEWNEKTGR